MGLPHGNACYCIGAICDHSFGNTYLNEFLRTPIQIPAFGIMTLLKYDTFN